MLNEDCIQNIWNMYYQRYVIEDITKTICTECKRQKQTEKRYCKICTMIQGGLTPGLAMIFSEWRRKSQLGNDVAQ